MVIYWLMFAFPSIFAIMEGTGERMRRLLGLAWLLAALLLAVLIGLRWETGGDWGNYQRMVEQALWTPRPLTPLGDPGFTLLIGEAARSTWGLLLVTAASGVLMAVALTVFCLNQPRPWLALAVAVPYLVVVMGMGYIRQGMAVSFLLLGLVSLGRGHLLRYAFWVALGACFHSTALILLPLGLMVVASNRIVRVILGCGALALLAYVILLSRTETYVSNYIEAEMASSGAAVRLLMTALPAALFLAFRDRFAVSPGERAAWTALSVAAIAAFFLLFAFPSSTVVDRLGLYLLPVQVFVYARVPDTFAADVKGQRILSAVILGLYAASFFVWLNYAENVSYWLPYRSYLFEDGMCLEC